MARKYDLISELYRRTAHAVVSDVQNWQAFLRCACRNYRLRFDEQLLIYAQRPDATAVLEIERWNDKFGRWVNRGAKGIAVFEDADRSRQRLTHYFDISDTHASRYSRPVPIWEMKPEYTDDVIESLENTFGELENRESLADAVLSAAKNAVEDNIPDYLGDLMYAADDSFLYGLSEDMITAMTNDFKSKQSSGARPPRLSPEEYAAKKKAEKEAIYQLLDNTASEVVQSPEKFKAYLDVQSRMDRYTANNALLMYKQFPQASQIKEFDDWAAEGVKVNKGSKTFIILDPYEYTKKDGTVGIDFNLKRVLDVSQTNGKRPAAPTANRDPRKLVAVMLDSAPINIESVSELPYPDMGAFYKNEDQTLYVKRDIGDSIALCQCVAQELGHAELSMNSEVYSRRDMGFQAVCIGYMLCKKYGVDTQNFAIDRIPDELKNKEPKDIKAELGKTQKAFKEITARVSDELYRQRAERSKEQER